LGQALQFFGCSLESCTGSLHLGQLGLLPWE
jgi:hypothetical protein